MAQGDILQAKFKLNVARQPAAFTLHYRVETSGLTNTDDSCLALGELLKDTEIANLHFHLGNDVTYEGWETRFVRGQDAFAPYNVQILNSVGQKSMESIPQVSAAVVRLVQLDRDAKHNGRCFVPGISEADTTCSFITSEPVINGINVAFNDVLVVSGDNQGITWGFQQVITGGNRNIGFTDTDVQRCECNSLIGSMRKRMTREFGTFP